MGIWVPIAMAAASIGSSIYNNQKGISAANAANKQSREWNEKMYALQRKDALEDREYMSPFNQRRLLEEAGINPAIMYGNGVEAQTTRASSPGSYTPNVPKFDYSGIPNAFMGLYDMQQKDAQTKAINSAARVSEQDVLLKAAQTLKTLTDNRSSEFDLKMKNELKEINIDQARTTLAKTAEEAANVAQDTSLKSAMYDVNIKKAYQELDNMKTTGDLTNRQVEKVKEEIKNLQKDGDLKQFQINLARLGISPDSPWFLKIVGQLFGKYVPTP